MFNKRMHRILAILSITTPNDTDSPQSWRAAAIPLVEDRLGLLEEMTEIAATAVYCDDAWVRRGLKKAGAMVVAASKKQPSQALVYRETLRALEDAEEEFFDLVLRVHWQATLAVADDYRNVLDTLLRSPGLVDSVVGVYPQRARLWRSHGGLAADLSADMTWDWRNTYYVYAHVAEVTWVENFWKYRRIDCGKVGLCALPPGRCLQVRQPADLAWAERVCDLAASQDVLPVLYDCGLEYREEEEFALQQEEEERCLLELSKLAMGEE